MIDILNSDITVFQQEAKKFSGQFHENLCLAKYTSWRVGGPGQFVYFPKDSDDLAQFIKRVPRELPVTWLGLGSNTLIRDGGVLGVVIITQGCLSKLTLLENNQVLAESGVGCAQVARFCARLGLTGVEFLAGIPGTIGGALAMNAGCFGTETWKHVESATLLNREGQFFTRPANLFKVAYREVQREANEWFVSGVFNLKMGNKEESLAKIRDLLDKRASTQPTSDHSCGSVFRNPINDFSGRLIEACGLKGYSIGGAQVSAKHANFIVNRGNATSDEIENLISHIANSVFSRFNIQLFPEVHVIGEKK